MDVELLKAPLAKSDASRAGCTKTTGPFARVPSPDGAVLCGMQPWPNAVAAVERRSNRRNDLGMTQQGTIIYTAKIRTVGGRDNGALRSSDGQLDIRLSAPGTARFGTNPEQLFAAAWSAGFERAVAQIARKKNVNLPAAVVIETEVDLILSSIGYFLRARFNVRMPGLGRDVAEAIMDEAQQMCPYSNAIRGNIDATFQLLPSADFQEKTDE